MDEAIRQKIIDHLTEKPNRLFHEILASTDIHSLVLSAHLQQMIDKDELIQAEDHSFSLPPKAKKK